MIIAAVVLYIIESPETTLAADGESDLSEGRITGLYDAFYWMWTTFTTYVDKTPKTPAGVCLFTHYYLYIAIM
jgi:hypothetical protein